MGIIEWVEYNPEATMLLITLFLLLYGFLWLRSKVRNRQKRQQRQREQEQKRRQEQERIYTEARRIAMQQNHDGMKAKATFYTVVAVLLFILIVFGWLRYDLGRDNFNDMLGKVMFAVGTLVIMTIGGVLFRLAQRSDNKDIAQAQAMGAMSEAIGSLAGTQNQLHQTGRKFGVLPQVPGLAMDQGQYGYGGYNGGYGGYSMDQGIMPPGMGGAPQSRPSVVDLYGDDGSGTIGFDDGQPDEFLFDD